MLQVRVGRVVVRRVWRRVRETHLQPVCQLLFHRHLLLTNVGISVVLSGAGDLLQQRLSSERRSTRWNLQRTAHMSSAGFTVGLLCHYWYVYLDALLPGRSLAVVVRKVALDQVVFSPVCIALFFATLGVVEGSSVKETAEETVQKGWRLYLAEWLIWPPVQAFNFGLLPTRFRVLYDNAVSLGYDVYSSYVKHDS